MTHTAVLVIVLVIACLWYTGQRSVGFSNGKTTSLLNVKVYAGLLGFALLLALLWQ